MTRTAMCRTMRSGCTAGRSILPNSSRTMPTNWIRRNATGWRCWNLTHAVSLPKAGRNGMQPIKPLQYQHRYTAPAQQVDCFPGREARSPPFAAGRTGRRNLPETRSDPMRGNITFTNSKGRGRNGWFRVATASLLGGHDQIYLDLSSKRVAGTPPICLELSPADAAALLAQLVRLSRELTPANALRNAHDELRRRG